MQSVNTLVAAWDWRKPSTRAILEQRVRFLTWFYLVTLVIVGVSTFPLEWEVNLLNSIVSLLR